MLLVKQNRDKENFTTGYGLPQSVQVLPGPSKGQVVFQHDMNSILSSEHVEFSFSSIKRI